MVARGKLRGVVALDGPSGTGKSTSARRLATTLSAHYLDTGAMYRAATLAVLNSQTELADPIAIAKVVVAAEIAVGTDPAASTVMLDGVDVATRIRELDINSAISAVARVPEVRTVLNDSQRQLITEAIKNGDGIVVEGRDIGTTVAPEAELKVYLTATPQARAQRRNRQERATGKEVTEEQTRAEVDRRDQLDNHTTPLQPAPDAVLVDTTDLDLAGVLETLLSLVDERKLCEPKAVGR